MRTVPGLVCETSVLPGPTLYVGMDESEVERLIVEGLPEAEATVTTPRDPDDDSHFAAEVVSPAFADESLVDRHQKVYDALGEHMTTDIHAIEIRAYTPEEYEG